MDISNELIEQYYKAARDSFRKSHPQWLFTIENGKLIGQLNKVYFGGDNVLTKEEQSYRHIVEIFSDGKFSQTDVETKDETKTGLGRVKRSYSFFMGESYHIASDRNSERQSIKDVLYDFFTSLGLRYYSFVRLRVGVTFTVIPIILLFMFASIISNSDIDVSYLFYAFIFATPWLLFGTFLISTAGKKFNILNMSGAIIVFVCYTIALLFFAFNDKDFINTGTFMACLGAGGVILYVFGNKLENKLNTIENTDDKQS